MSRRIFFYGIALMIPALWLLPANMDWHLMVKPVNAFNLLYLGLFASALCFLTWNRVVEILGSRQIQYLYLHGTGRSRAGVSHHSGGNA